VVARKFRHAYRAVVVVLRNEAEAGAEVAREFCYGIQRGKSQGV